MIIIKLTLLIETLKLNVFRLVESSGFLRYRVDISRNLRLVDLSRFPRFYFRFRFRVVYYKVFLLITGGGK